MKYSLVAKGRTTEGMHEAGKTHAKRWSGVWYLVFWVFLSHSSAAWETWQELKQYVWVEAQHNKDFG